MLVHLQCFDAVGWTTGRTSGLYKTEWWGAGVVVCLEQGADLHMAQLMPPPLTVCCFSKIQIGFTFLVPAHPGSPGKSAVKLVCVCVCVYVCVSMLAWITLVLCCLSWFCWVRFSQHQAKRLAGKSISEMTNFVSSGT